MARDESKVFGSDQDNVGEGESQPLPEEMSQTSERPTGVEEIEYCKVKKRQERLNQRNSGGVQNLLKIN